MPKKTIEETLLYPVILHREGDLWGYFSPQFGGGGAPTQADAVRLARELLEGEIAELTENGETAPLPPEPHEIDAGGGIVAWLPVLVSNASERVSLTLPKSLLAKVDAITPNRSAFFTELARERLGS